ncbi:MmpS family transport accessory protein [Nonomuraea typhae]|uniref:MmpS family transport accessory protein n=1 Tax=Nonomuraea typhae TaxID=2603600 RepID=A0ABW7YLY6_9ACTN
MALVIGVPLLLLGSCTAVFLVIGDSGSDRTSVITQPGPKGTEQPAQQQNSAPPASTTQAENAGKKVVLEVVGADGAASISTLTYMVKWDLKQESGLPLPWTKEISSDQPYPLSLIAQNAGQSGAITCRIKVDGNVIREAKGEGMYGVCNVRADAP